MRLAVALTLSIGLLLNAEFVSAQSSPSTVVGIWAGVLDAGTARLRLVFKITQSDDGVLTGTLDSPDQGASDLSVDAVKVTGNSIEFGMTALGARFEGKLNDDATAIAGTFYQGGAELPLELSKSDEAPAPTRRSQDPEPPYPYDEEEVSYESLQAGVRLAGTLTLPRRKGPFPAALLISGSGPQDRDESIAGHRPFLVLADHLTRRGIAVLRVDDRGVGGSSGDSGESTSEELAQDVRAGVNFLASHARIDAGHIGLIGHSEGGLIAPLVANDSKDVAFLVMIAGPGVPGERILYQQGELMARAMGGDDAMVARQRRVQEGMFELATEEIDDDTAAARLDELITSVAADLNPAEQELAEAQRPQIEAQLNRVRSAWFRFFLTYDPRPALQKVECPVLAVIGEKDLQVPPYPNLTEIEKALAAGGNKDHTVKRLPGLNHLLQTAGSGSPTEYASIEETIAPAALELIGDWIVERARSTEE